MRPWTLAIEAWRFCRPVGAIHITLTRNSIRIRIIAKNLIRIRTQVKIRIWIRINNDADPQPWLDTINWFLAWWLNDRLWLFSYFLFNVQVERTRQAQSELKDQIECLYADLKRIAEEQSCPVDLGTYRIFIYLQSCPAVLRIQDLFVDVPFFVAKNFTKWKIILFLKRYRKNLSQFTWNLVIFNLKNCQ